MLFSSPRRRRILSFNQLVKDVFGDHDPLQVDCMSVYIPLSALLLIGFTSCLMAVPTNSVVHTTKNTQADDYRNSLPSTADQDLQQQLHALTSEFETHMGQEPQVDDVLLVGVRI